MTQRFDVKKYSKLQEANKLLGKTIMTTDQLHMNFISSMHTTAFTVLKQHIDQTSDEKQKNIFKYLCEVRAQMKTLLLLCFRQPLTTISYLNPLSISERSS